MQKTLHVLIERHGNAWTAQVIEHDPAAQAARRENIEYEVQRMIVGHVVSSLEHGLVPFEMPPAPPISRLTFDSLPPGKRDAAWFEGWSGPTGLAGPMPALEFRETT